MTVHLSIVGRKNSGKTTLVVALIEELVARGFRVGSVKHTSHDHSFDVPGKDSWRHQEAGSEVAVILSPDRWVCHARDLGPAERRSLQDLLFRGKDIVLWEGRGNPDAPMVECVPLGAEPLHRGRPGLCALVGGGDADPALRHFRSDATAALADWIEAIIRGQSPFPGKGDGLPPNQD